MPEGLEKKEPSGAVGRSVNWLQPLRRTVWRSSLKTWKYNYNKTPDKND